MKKYLFFTLCAISSLFSARIGILCIQPHVTSTCIQEPELIQKKLTSHGHECIFIPVNGPQLKKAYACDLLLTIYERSVPKYLKNKTILYMLEPVVIEKIFGEKAYLDRFHKVFTWNYNDCDNKKYYKAFFPALGTINEAFKPFSERKLVFMMNSDLSDSVKHPEELYSTRKKIAHFYNNNYPNEFELYGWRGWPKQRLSVFKGKCNDRNPVYQNHKFSYCYENWHNDYHYISEKIFYCFQNLCVPIYFGCKNITDYIPKNTFIDARDFSSIEDIHQYISNMDEETWMGYIKAIKEFYKSESAKNFDPEHYSDRVVEVILQSIEELK